MPNSFTAAPGEMPYDGSHDGPPLDEVACQRCGRRFQTVIDRDFNPYAVRCFYCEGEALADRLEQDLRRRELRGCTVP